MGRKLVLFIFIANLIAANMFASKYLVYIQKQPNNCKAELIDGLDYKIKQLKNTPYKVCIDKRCFNVLFDFPTDINITAGSAYILLDFYPTSQRLKIYENGHLICTTNIIDCKTDNLCNKLCEYDPDCIKPQNRKIQNFSSTNKIEKIVNNRDLRRKNTLTISVLISFIIFIIGIVFYIFRKK